MHRTTVRLPDDLLHAAQERARQTGRTFTQLLEDALRAALTHGDAPARVAERSPIYQARVGNAGTGLTSVEPHAPSSHRDQLAAQVEALQQFLQAVPDRDCRAPDEILGYDRNGLPS